MCLFVEHTVHTCPLGRDCFTEHMMVHMVVACVNGQAQSAGRGGSGAIRPSSFSARSHPVQDHVQFDGV